MKAIVATTYDEKYLFFLPIITWCWNKLNAGVICFLPQPRFDKGKAALVIKTIIANNLKCELQLFNCPINKEATYAQISRLYAASLGMDKEDILVTSDVDMASFQGMHKWLFPEDHIGIKLEILGPDLTPARQYPMCYAKASAGIWRRFMEIGKKTPQECLDEQLGGIECEGFRGNMWSRDQELLFNHAQKEEKILFNRARPGTQFASNRVDRDDINWRSYLGPDLVDAHLWRPGFTDENFANIMELLQTQYPTEDFQWLIDYRNAYISLL